MRAGHKGSSNLLACRPASADGVRYTQAHESLTKAFKQIKSIAIHILLLCLVSPIIGQAELSPQEKVEDVSYLSGALLEAHPSAGRYTTVEAVMSLAQSLKEAVSFGKEKFSFRLAVAHIVARMHCVHTSLLSAKRITKKYLRKHGLPAVLPVQTWYDGEELWLAHVFLDTLRDLKGMRVDSIDHKPVGEVMEALMKYRSGDGYGDAFMRATINRSVQFSLLYKQYYQPDTAIYMSGTVRGERKTALVPFRKMKIPVLRRSVKNPLFETPNHSFYLDSQSMAAVLRIESFNPQRKTRRFYRNLFSWLEENRVTDLVIDLRGNSGGNINEAKRLLTYTQDTTVFYTLEKQRQKLCRYGTFMSNYYAFADFIRRRVFSCAKRYRKDGRFILEQRKKPRKKHRFKGQIYILQDGFTASSSSFVSAYLDQNANAIVIGTESGGGAAGNNGLLYATSKLPNSRIRVRLPQYWLNYHLKPDRGRGVVPDIPVHYTIDDVMAHRDLEMQVVRSIIKKNKS